MTQDTKPIETDWNRRRLFEQNRIWFSMRNLVARKMERDHRSMHTHAIYRKPYQLWYRTKSFDENVV